MSNPRRSSSAASRYTPRAPQSPYLASPQVPAPPAPGPYSPYPNNALTPRPGAGSAYSPAPNGLPPVSSDRPRGAIRPPPAGFRPSKRLIVCCDGTWLNSDNSFQHGQLAVPSNVTRISRAINAESSDGIPQIAYYQPGVGTAGSMISRIIGGATAEGLSGNIREAYAFLANNYTRGDELFLVGFSRGAFTARSVAALINKVGLLTKSGLPSFGVVFKDFENRMNRNYESAYPNLPFPNKGSPEDPAYAQELSRRRLSQIDIPIKAVACFDTVGSLGIPRIGVLERLGIQRPDLRELAFYDTALGNNIENAFQALALDEHRAAFTPAVWEKKKDNNTNLRQVWFPGVHSNIGGGYDDQEVANITLAWMIAQLEPFLEFNGNYLVEQFQANREYYLATNQDPRDWSFGEIYNSMKGVYALGGRTIRTPGFYERLNPDTGVVNGRQLRNTSEYMHPSVRSRTELNGPGSEDRGVYMSKALDGYDMKPTGSGPDSNMPMVIWESRAKRKGKPSKVLPESPIWPAEQRLLAFSPKVEDFIFDDRRRRRR